MSQTIDRDVVLPIRSASFVLTALLVAFLLFLGVRGMFDAAGAAHGFGVDLAAPLDAFYLHVKADRDLCLAACLGALMLYRRTTPLLLFVAASLVAPIFDAALSIADPRGHALYALLVHGSAVVYGVLLVALLWRARNRPAALS